MKIGNPPLVTVFGGGGFVGRYVCEYLLKTGARVRIAQRELVRTEATGLAARDDDRG